MARGQTGIDGIDKVTKMFPAGSHKALERLLLRAAEREAKQAGQNVRAAVQGAMGASRETSAIASRLAGELGKAVRQRAEISPGRASIRHKAPDGGGRPFHFAHSIVHRDDAHAAGCRTAAAGRGGGRASGAGKRAKLGTAAAHMKYVERDGAVERSPIIDRDGPDVLVDAGRGPERGRQPGARVRDDGSWDRERGPGAAGSAAQGYIENLEKVEETLFSFGTIGVVFENRVAFWEALAEAEPHPDARVQNRIIAELPHEASPQARYDIVRRFCEGFERDGVPYWAALHAPDKNNDARNYHVHIVYSERPAKRMLDPADDVEKWDFEIIETRKKKSRNTVVSRPYRQSKLRSYTARDAITTTRKAFSDAANAVLERDDVRSESGEKVRYDPRSYADMGVDVVPMRSIDRIVADKVKSGGLTVLDGDYTKRMIAAELRDAAEKRDEKVLELVALEGAIREATGPGRPQDKNGKLPPELRISPLTWVMKSTLKVAGRRILETRHAMLGIDVMERATTVSIERVIAATAPRAVEAAAKVRDPARRAEAPAADAAGLIHAAAIEELQAMRASTAVVKRSLGLQIRAAVDAWRDLVKAPPTDMSPVVNRLLREAEPQTPSPERTAGTVASESDLRESSRSPPTGRNEKPRTEGREDTLAAPQRAGAPPVEPQDRQDAVAARRDRAVDLTTPTRGRISAEVGVDAGPRPAENASAAISPRRTMGVEMPGSLEDVHRIRMPPTTPELEAASKSVSAWIKAIADSEPDPEKRIPAVEALVAALRDDLRRRKGEVGIVGSGMPTGGRPRAMPDVTVTGRGSAATERGAATGTARQSLAGERTEAPPDAAQAGSAMREPVSTGGGGAAGVPGPIEEHPPTSDEVVPTKVPEGPVREPDAEDPDDARRRRERKKKIEERKKKRKAVLGRRNKARGRDDGPT